MWTMQSDMKPKEHELCSKPEIRSRFCLCVIYKLMGGLGRTIWFVRGELNDFEKKILQADLHTKKKFPHNTNAVQWASNWKTLT